MKKLFLIIICFAICLPLTYAQSTVPLGMKYQAVARNLSGEVIADQEISLNITLHSSDKSRESYYIENHSVTTNQFGLFTLVIGEGKVEKGSFIKVPWSQEDIWMEIAIKNRGETKFTSISNSKLLAVPYAFHAATASELINGNNTSGDRKGVPSNVWSLFGNANTDPTQDAIGTTDSTDFVFITNDIERMRILADGTILMGNLNVDSLTVNYNTKLNVKGGYTINYGDFTVENSSSTLLTGTLAVDKSTLLKNSLTVLGPSAFYNTIRANGQVTINANLTGPDSVYNSYPLQVEGGDQGIAIKVNGNRNNANNFITFWDFNGIHGRIEGQTLTELHQNPQFIFDLVMGGFDIAFPYAEAIACAAQLDAFETVTNILQGVQESVKLVQYVYKEETSVGIAFESGSGDYAEWLKKSSPEEIYQYGEIVGVIGGNISKKTDNANHLMVISKSPIVLGNMPPKNEKANYEKVAFMGQVPVRVVGKVEIGDYILPSGNNDGIGIAANPNKMKSGDYKKIVGVAWSDSKNSLVNYINTAVGINTNDLANELARQQEEINELNNKFDKLLAYVNGNKNEGFNLQKADSVTPGERKEASLSKDSTNQLQFSAKKFPLSDQEFEKMLNESGYVFKEVFNELKTYFDKNGINYKQYPDMKRIVDDPLKALRDMHNGDFMPTVWQQLEGKYFDKRK